MTDRKEFIRKFAERLNKWDDKLIEGENKIENINSDLKESAKKQLDDIREKIEKAKQELDETKDEPTNTWEELQKGIEANWNQFESTMKKISSINRLNF